VPGSQQAAILMASGKRLRASDPLTEHDVAERLDKAALRVLRIMSDARQQGYMEAVRHSRYLTNVLGMLAAELVLWNAEPQDGYASDYPGYPGTGGTGTRHDEPA
jgi:hypothetical protein